MPLVYFDKKRGKIVVR